MGVYNKKKKYRRRFGQTNGKNSKTRQRKEKVQFLKKEERTRLYANDKNIYIYVSALSVSKKTVAEISSVNWNSLNFRKVAFNC